METEYNVATASIQTGIFEPLVKASTLQQGIPYLRHAYVPQPVMGRTPVQLRAYVDGPDDVTGRPFMTEVIAALTRPRSTDETRRHDFDRSTPRLVEPDSEENLHQLFVESLWTDMLPIILPTEERVACMLEGTSRSPDTVVGQMRPNGHARGLGVHGRKGCCQRGDGWGQTGIPPCHSGAGRDGRLGAGQHDQLRRVHGRGQRSRPP